MSPSSCPLIFMGTPDFSVPTLSYLLEQGFPVAAVYTQPPRPKGRGYKVTPCPVQIFAQEQDLPVVTPGSLRDPSAQQDLVSCVQKNKVQAIVVVAYGSLLPSEALRITPLGCLNIHASLLPRWRGAAPINRCIEAGDAQTGITIMQMEEGLDTGPIYLEQSIPIASTDTASSIAQTLSYLGGPLVHKTLQGLLDHSLIPRSQPEQGVTYAHKVTSEEMYLDFSASAQRLTYKIRAFSPSPGARFVYEKTLIKILAATCEADSSGSSHPTGTIMNINPLAIRCGDNSLLKPTLLQKEGGRPLPIEDFQRGFHFAPFSQVTLSSLPPS